MLTTAQPAAACTMRSASKMGILLLWILAAALVAYSLMLVFLSNFNMGNLMVWVLTAAITACAIWHKPLAGWLRTGAGRVVGIVLGVLLVVYLALIGFVAVSGYANPPTGQEQVMIVLGAGLRKDKPSMLLRYRLDKAYAYAAEHPDLLIVTSGGQGRDEWIPEGQAMRDYLIEKGLPADRVLAENKSTSTEENFAFSLDILKERGYSADTPIVYVLTHSTATAPGGMRRGPVYHGRCAACPHAVAQRAACYLREGPGPGVLLSHLKLPHPGPMHAMVGLLDLNKRFLQIKSGGTAMQIRYYKEYSRYLDRFMEFKVYGHAGRPIIIFPCQSGRFYDWEDRNMCNLAAPWIDSGKLQIFTADIDPSWDNHGPERPRIEMQELLTDIVVPALLHRCADARGRGCPSFRDRCCQP